MLAHIFRKELKFKLFAFICHLIVEFFEHTLKFYNRQSSKALFKRLNNLNQEDIFMLRFSIMSHDRFIQQILLH
jgi:hypothetical protein